MKESSCTRGARVAVAEVIAPGIVRSPYASAGSTQQLSREQWQPGGEFICAESGRTVLLPLDLPPAESAPPALPAKAAPKAIGGSASAPVRPGSTGVGDRLTFAGEMRKLQIGSERTAKGPPIQPPIGR